MNIATEQVDSVVQLVNLKLRSFLRRFEIDRAVFFGLSAKIWGLCAGLVTAILIASKFTPELQGYYFAFLTIVVLQVFVELGLGAVIVQFSGHEWAKLSLDESGRIVGDANALSRLVSIANIASRWYLLGGIIVALGLGVGGFIFFSNSSDMEIPWTKPWFLLCLISGINICLVPMGSILEGCNQVARLYTFRFFQGAVSTIAVWIAILLGAGLWTVSMSGTATLLCWMVFVRRRYWTFFRTLLLSKPTGPKISWRNDMLPMQWRMAIATISWFFIFSFFVPVAFRFQGPVIAGQMGLTNAVIMAIGNLSFSWLTPKIPQFCILIAEQKYEELDRRFFHNTALTLILLFSTSSTFVVGIYLINRLGISFAHRLLPPVPAGIFMLANFIGALSAPFSSYMRAHRREPIVLVTISSVILIGGFTFITGKYYSINAMAVCYLVINMGVTVSIILIWHYHRLEWHSKKAVAMPSGVH